MNGRSDNCDISKPVPHPLQRRPIARFEADRTLARALAAGDDVNRRPAPGHPDWNRPQGPAPFIQHIVRRRHQQNGVAVGCQHAEDLAAQRRSLALSHALDPEDMQYAKRHYEIIARFGRFPHRNAALGRESTAEEIEFLKQPGSSF